MWDSRTFRMKFREFFFSKNSQKRFPKDGCFRFPISVCGDGQMNAKQVWYYAKFFGKCY